MRRRRRADRRQTGGRSCSKWAPCIWVGKRREITVYVYGIVELTCYLQSGVSAARHSQFVFRLTPVDARIAFAPRIYDLSTAERWRHCQVVDVIVVVVVAVVVIRLHMIAGARDGENHPNENK